MRTVVFVQLFLTARAYVSPASTYLSLEPIRNDSHSVNSDAVAAMDSLPKCVKLTNAKLQNKKKQSVVIDFNGIYSFFAKDPEKKDSFDRYVRTEQCMATRPFKYQYIFFNTFYNNVWSIQEIGSCEIAYTVTKGSSPSNVLPLKGWFHPPYCSGDSCALENDCDFEPVPGCETPTIEMLA